MMLSTRDFQWLFLIFGLSICITFTSSKDVRVVCYYTNWSVYRPGTAKFSPQNINPYLCTHLIYAFGGFTKENTLKPFDKYQDIEKGGYAKFTGLKTYNKDLKTLLAIGGWNEASSRFSPMVASADRRKQLVKNSIKFLRQNNFDGLDLDWEYPAFREGGKPRDKENYAKLVQELREEFERESEKTGRTRLLLTMAVPAGIEYINKGYDIPKLTKYLDWMNILSYDYHSAFEPAVNHHAPLFPLREATEYDYDAELNIDYTIKHYLEMGADPNKLVMGVPTYGRSYTLFNPDANAIGDPADGPGEMGEATRENGYLAYYEICENVKSNGWTVVQPNDKAMGPYAYKENQWVGYDDENIARRKAEYVARNGLGGIMFWAIDNDDFRGSCHGKPYPLIEAAKEALISASGLTDENLISPPSKPTKSKSRLRNRPKTTEEPSTEKSEVAQKTNSSRRRNRLKSKANNRVSDSDSKSKSRRNEAKKAEIEPTYSSLKVITPAYTTPEPPSTPDQGGAFKCEDEGFFPHPKDCKKYFWCLSGPGELGIVAHQFTCPAGLFFNKAADSCDYSQNVLCNKKLSKTTSTTEGKKNVETVKTTIERISTTAATRRTTARTTTTTEEEYDDEYEYEDEEINDGKSDSEEDPRVIKELLDLIKKAGGIEELEKQLNIGHEEVKEGATTPSTRTKSIVEKFLTSRNNKNTSGTSKYTTINRNSRGPQNAGIEKDDDIQKKTDKRPQYTTISRKRPTPNKNDTDDEEEEKEEKDKPVVSKYATIRRSKEGLTIENRPIVDRNKILGEEDRDTEDSNRREVTVHTTPQYVNIRRQRPTTTTDQSSTAKYVSIRRSTTEESVKEEEKEEPTTSRNEVSDSPITERSTPSLRYQTLNRQATTTTREISSSTEPTTTKEVPSTQQDISTTPDIPSTTYSRSTEIASTTTTEVTDEPSSSPSSSTAATSSTSATSTEETKIQTTKSPVLFEPRPFSKSTISTTHKPVRTNIRSTTSPTKVSDTTVRSRFRRPFVNKNIDNADGVSDNSVESESSTENVSTTRRTLRNKSRFSRPDVANNEDSTAPAKPTFRQRIRPLSPSSTQKTISDNEQDEIQRKYRPLSLDDLSSLTAADITIQKVNRDGGFRRTRLRTTTTDTPEEVSTTRRKTFERSRISSTGRSTISTSTTEKTFIDEEQNEIKFENRSRYSENTSESPKVITTRRRTFYRPRQSTVEQSSSEINNDLNDQIKSGTDEVQLGKQSRNESSGSEVLKRPVKRMRKVLKRLRTSTLPPSTAVTHRGKSLSYADLDLDVITTSEGSSSTPRLILVDADSNEASISDETIDEDENIKLSATNIRENSNINSGNAIYDIGFRKFNKAEVVFDKTRYGSKYDVVATTPTTTSTADYDPAKTRKFIRRLRPTEPTSQQESPKTESYSESSTETKPGRSRKVIRRLRPNTKSFSGENLDTSSEANQEKIAKNYRTPQFFEKRRQYYNRDSIKITKNSNFNRKFTTEGSVSTQGVYNRFGNVKDTGTTSSSEETETNVETTTHRGSLKYVDIVRPTTSTENSADQADANEKDKNRAFYFTTPQASTLADDSSEFSSTTNSEATTFSSHNESRETETSTKYVSELSESETEKMPTEFEEITQKALYETTETISSDEYTTTAAEGNTFIDSKTVEDTAVSSDATDDVEVHSTISPENETTNLSTEDVSTLSSTFETTTPTTTTEYTRKSTLRSSRLRPTYQIRRSTTSTTAKTPKESKLSDKSPKFFTRRKPSFRQKSSTEPNTSQEKPSSEKPRRRYPFSKYGRVSTTASFTDVDQLETKTSSPETSSIEAISEENVSSEKSQPARHFTKSTTEVYKTSTESNKSLKSDTSEKQKLRNKALFSKKRKMNIPIHSSSEIKEESTTEHYTTLYHVFAEPEVHENDTTMMMNNETNVNEEGRIEPLVEINRIIEVHIKNENDNSSGVNNEAKSIFDKIGAINRVTSIKVVDGNGTKIADLPLDQTSQRLAVVHDIIAQEKKNEAISEHRKERKFDFDVKSLPNNELKNGLQRPEIIDGISHIKVITPKPILSAEVSTIALEALFSTTEKSKISEDKNSTALAENELLDADYSRFVNIRIIKPVDGRSLSEDVPADTPKVVKLLSSDEEVTMEAKVVEVTPKNLDQTIRIAPIQVAMARTIADTPIVGIKRLNEKISNTPFRSSLDSGEH